LTATVDLSALTNDIFPPKRDE